MSGRLGAAHILASVKSKSVESGKLFKSSSWYFTGFSNLFTEEITVDRLFFAAAQFAKGQTTTMVSIINKKAKNMKPCNQK